MKQHTTERQRVKVSVTVDPRLLAAVDAFVATHSGFDRSKVLDEALLLWYARQQEQAMEAQYAAPDAGVAAEQAEWREIRQTAAARRFVRRRD